jgi:hypothetical protein
LFRSYLNKILLETGLLRRVFLLSFFLLLGESLVFSCPVCRGAAGDPATEGMNLAIATLLGVTGSVLAGIVSFFLRVRKRTRKTSMGEGIH